MQKENVTMKARSNYKHEGRVAGGLRICISNEFSDDVHVAGLGTTPEDHWFSDNLRPGVNKNIGHSW